MTYDISSEIQRMMPSLFDRFWLCFPGGKPVDANSVIYHTQSADAANLAALSKEITEAALVAPNVAAIHLLQGHIAMQQDNTDQAIRYYQNAVGLEQDDLTGYGVESAFALGAAHFKKGNYAEAVDYFADARRRDPGNTNIHQFFTQVMEAGKTTPTVVPAQTQQPLSTQQEQLLSSIMSQNQPQVQPQQPSANSVFKPTVMASRPQTQTPCSASNLTIPKVPNQPVQPPPQPPAPRSNLVLHPVTPIMPQPKPSPKPKSKPQPAAKTQDEGCFIATAAYGSPDVDVVLRLREFRDERLLTSGLGTVFVRIYYRFSPPVARFIRDKESTKAAIRKLLKTFTSFLR